MPIIDLPTFQNVHYITLGEENSSAPLLVCVHGITASIALLNPFLDVLVQQGLRVIACDLPGHGLSGFTRLPMNRVNSLSFFDELFSNVIPNNEPFHLLGHSMGGALTTLFINANAKTKKFSVLSHILLAPHVLLDSNIPFTAKLMKIPYLNSILIRLSGRNDLINHLASTNKDPVVAEMFTKYLHELFNRRPEYITGTFLNYYCNFIKYSYIEDYAALDSDNLPRLLIWGDEDQVITSNQINCLKGMLTRCKFEVLEGRGHELEAECPVDLVSICLNFVNSVSECNTD
ncbi:hypothetical protein RCL1_005665 [Eukaryota sp. TZLM3-RCL]